MPVVTQTGQFGLALLVLVDQPDLVLSEQFVVQQGGIMRSEEQLIACLRGAAGHATLALMGDPFFQTALWRLAPIGADGKVFA